MGFSIWQGISHAYVGGKVREIAAGRTIAHVPENSTFLGFLPAGKQYVIGCRGGRQRPQIRKSETGDVVREIHVVPKGYGVSHYALSPDGKLLATQHISEKAIKIWSVDTGEEKLTLQAPMKADIRICFSPNGKMIAYACEKTVTFFRRFNHNGSAIL